MRKAVTLFAILLAFGSMPALAALQVGTGFTLTGAVGDNLQRSDAGSLNMLTTGSYLFGNRWNLLVDVEQGTGETMPSSLYFSWVAKGAVGDPHFYMGLGSNAHWRESITHMGGGLQLGFILPVSEVNGLKLGFKGYYIDQEGWYVRMEHQFVSSYGVPK